MLDECDDTEDTDAYSAVDTEEEGENCDEIQAPEADSVEYECVSSKEDFEEEEAVLEHLNTSIPTTHTAIHPQWQGYKIVGDNINKNVHSSFQREMCTTHSLHYFHSYAVLDRIDLSGVSDEPALKPININDLLPSS